MIIGHLYLSTSIGTIPQLKKNRLRDQMCKQNPSFYCIQDNISQEQRQIIPQQKELDKGFPSKQTQNTTPNKRDVQQKIIKRDGEGHSIFIKGKIHQEDISILNIYDSNSRTVTFGKEMLIKSCMKCCTLTVGDFNKEHT